MEVPVKAETDEAEEIATKAEEVATRLRNRRASPRYGVDGDAHLLLLNLGSTLPCRIVDLSLNGCLMRTQERFVAGMLVRVEVAFKVRGFAFRFGGVTQWTDGRHLAGIRFVDVSMRRREELVEALREVEAEIAAKAGKSATEMQAAAPASEPVFAVEIAKPTDAQRVAEEQIGRSPSTPFLVMTPAQASAERSRPITQTISVPVSAAGPQPDEPQTAEPLLAGPKSSKRERRVQSRQEVDTSAVIHLVNVQSHLTGRILDLSLGGCRIRTDERFPVGIYTRVETEFRLGGLSFRLGGVTQAIHDQRHVGIRFLDMSPRKREQVEQLIEEIREMKEKRGLDLQGGPLE